jgi:BASS family bile acid:Na+ symporter
MIGEFLNVAFEVTYIIFMVGNLAGMGLQLAIADAIVPLRSPRFVLVTLLICFVFGPIFAYAITLVVPMARPYVVGMLLGGLAPSAPYLPLTVQIARGDLAAAASLMLLAAAGTVAIMVVGVPFVAPDLSVNAWSVAKPLLLLMLIPLAVGLLIKHRWPALADKLYPPVKIITNIGTVLFLVVAVALHYELMLGAVGSGAFTAQMLFAAGLALGGYWLTPGLSRERKIVLSLASCSRNAGAPFAVIGAGGDHKIVVMLIIGIFVSPVHSSLRPGSAKKWARRESAMPTSDQCHRTAP